MLKTPNVKLATFDLETDPFKRLHVPVPFASDFYYENHHSTTWGPACLPNLIELLKHYDGIAYAHNGGKFDFHFLLPYLPRKYIKRLLTINGRIVQMVFEWGLDMRDSYALIPRALREWAKEDIDIAKLEADVRESHRPEITRYLKKDTEYLHEMVEAFIGEYGLHLTLASASFQILHKKFDVKRVKISESQDAKFRKFYFAGRVEFYALGELTGPFTCVDINSSFPWSMTQDHWEGEEYLCLSELPKRNLLQSFIRIKAESLGAFPFREVDGSVSFPLDGVPREFFITGWEYQAAKELNILGSHQIIDVFVPTSIRNYSQYIEYFYKIKNSAETSGNKGERLFAKLLMNSGYGKFGMDPREFEELAIRDWRDKPDVKENEPDWEILKDDPSIGITIYKRPAGNTYGKFNNVCVAASITGCSRALLLRASKVCRGLVYCDTDSLIARDIGNIPVGPRLGEWKIEHIFSKLYIGGKKLYAGKHPPDSKGDEWKTASKGVRLTPDQIIEVAKGEDKGVTYAFDAPSFSLRKNIDRETKLPLWHRFTKRTVRRADKIGSKKGKKRFDPN